jgi:hypothetical protein
MTSGKCAMSFVMVVSPVRPTPFTEELLVHPLAFRDDSGRVIASHFGVVVESRVFDGRPTDRLDRQIAVDGE